MKPILPLLLLLLCATMCTARVRMEFGIAAGPCFPVMKERLTPTYAVSETPYNATQAMVRTDVFSIKGNSRLNGYTGVHIGGFQFFVRQEDGKTKKNEAVGYGVFAIALGCVYTIPLTTDWKLRFRAGGGLGFAVSGFFYGIEPGLPLELQAGVVYKRFLLNVGYMNFIGGKFSGFEYGNNSNRGMYQSTNRYAVQGVVAELGIQFYK